MGLIVEEGVWEMFPGMQLVVAYVEGVDNQAANPGVAQAFAHQQEDVRTSWEYANAQSHPLIAAWRTAFRDALKLKGSEFPSSIEALAKRVLSGKGVSPVSSVVDFYNLVSLRHVVPVGGWDVDGMAGGDIVLRHTRAGEEFQELGALAPVVVAAGEVGYADAAALITRHFVWRQSEQAKVTHGTRRLFLVSEILSVVGEDVAQAVERSFGDGLREHFGVGAHSTILSAGHRRWEWPSG